MRKQTHKKLHSYSYSYSYSYKYLPKEEIHGLLTNGSLHSHEEQDTKGDQLVLRASERGLTTLSTEHTISQYKRGLLFVGLASWDAVLHISSPIISSLKDHPTKVYSQHLAVWTRYL